RRSGRARSVETLGMAGTQARGRWTTAVFAWGVALLSCPSSWALSPIKEGLRASGKVRISGFQNMGQQEAGPSTPRSRRGREANPLEAHHEKPAGSTARKKALEGGAQGRRLPLWLRKRGAKSGWRDRKSTRLNSSHGSSSYA